jgi:malate dehydrogenase (oxaloacetate-decarboxylating)
MPTVPDQERTVPDVQEDSAQANAPLRVAERGRAVLANAFLNRGTAFTIDQRRALGLIGLLPSGVASMDRQLRRVYAQYQRQPTPLAKNVYLSNLRDRNTVLFFRLLADNIEEMMPIVYTPTIGEAIERFSHEYNRARGVFLSIDRPQDIEQSLLDYGLGPDQVDLVVTTDGEGILGIGDQGVGGIQIAIGKLSVYTAAAGIHPLRVIPVVLDVGTDNLGLLNDEMYLGERHARVRGEAYDAFVDEYVRVVTRLFPRAMLHWEDLGAGNAHRILQRYRQECCTFNDDVQGTAAVSLAAILAGAKVTGMPLRDHRVVIFGAGTAGIGVADLVREEMMRQGLTEAQAQDRFYCLGSRGLLTDARPEQLRPFQVPYARAASEVGTWPMASASGTARIGLADVVRQVRPTILVGTSTVGGAFTEEVVRGMAAHCERPIIMPLSNPTSRAEAVPADVLHWTDGRALVATGSPFAPVDHGGISHEIAQANNALIFPGLGLAVAACRASRVTDRMIAASATALADLVNAYRPGAPLLPPMSQLRMVSASVAIAVARAAADDGVAELELTDPVREVYNRMWRPEYPPVEAI